jgi:hypothetical protein
MNLEFIFLYVVSTPAMADISIIGTREMTSLPGQTYGGDPSLITTEDVGVGGSIGQQVNTKLIPKEIIHVLSDLQQSLLVNRVLWWILSIWAKLQFS